MLSADFGHLERDTKMIDRSRAEWVHIDVMDGVFVPNISFGFPVLKAITSATEKFMDVHLMIVEPEKYVGRFADAGADLVTFHWEATEDVEGCINLIREKGVKVGVSIKPKTPVSVLEDILPKVDLVLIMSVEPGFGGQSFMADMMPKVSALRKLIDEKNPACELEVDGGIDPATAPVAVAAGANVLVAGSAVYKAADIPARIRELRG